MYMGKFLNSTTNFLYLIAKIASFLLHLWTLYIAYKVGGLLSAIITFFLPIISQIYWSYDSYRIYAFDSAYIQWVIVISVFWVFIFAFGVFSAYLSTVLDKRTESKEMILDYKDDLFYELSQINPSDYAYWLEVNRPTITKVLGNKGYQEIRDHIKSGGSHHHAQT